MPLPELEAKCNKAASALDAIQPRPASLLRIQQLLLHIVILLNAGNTKDSYSVLEEAVKEARDIHLFLEEKWEPMAEFDRETRRRVFWNIHIWDRYVFLLSTIMFGI